jgi:nucleotide-binding universal stress UspA family protein
MPLVYGHDFSDVSTALVAGAAALATLLDLPLVLVHVRKVDDAALDPDADARLGTRARERLEALAVELTRAWPGCRARAVVLRGHPASELAAEAARNRADLLVVSSGRHGGPSGALERPPSAWQWRRSAWCRARTPEPFEAWARGTTAPGRPRGLR